jgi:hypothetical protein
LRSQLVSPNDNSFPSAANYLTLAKTKEEEYRAKIEQLRLTKTKLQIEFLRMKAIKDKEIQQWKSRWDAKVLEHNLAVSRKDDEVRAIQDDLDRLIAISDHIEASKKEEINLLNDKLDRLISERLCERRENEARVNELIQSKIDISNSYNEDGD